MDYLCKWVFFFNINLFIYFWLCWVFAAAHRLSLVVVSRSYSSLRCTGFSLWWLLLLWITGSRRVGSVVVARGLSSCSLQAPEQRLSSCGTRTQLLHGMWDLPGPGLKPVSPALAGGFLTTAPPGKPLCKCFIMNDGKSSPKPNMFNSFLQQGAEILSFQQDSMSREEEENTKAGREEQVHKGTERQCHPFHGPLWSSLPK